MLYRNLPLKAASLVLAIFLWFWVMLNEENPLTRRTIEVRIDARGVGEGLTARPDTRIAKVTLTGLEQDMTDLTGQLRAEVSCTGLDEGRYRLAVRVEAPEDVNVVTVRPERVSVALERIVSQAKPVEVRLVGEPIGGLEVEGAACSPKQVLVSGARSSVGRTVGAVVTADVARMVPGIPVRLPARAVDRSGSPVEGVEIKPSRVQVTALTQRVVVSQVLPVELRTRGTLPAGLRLVSVQLDPPVVTVVLPASRAAVEKRIDTEPLNLGAVYGNTSRRLLLVAPPGASLAGDASVRVTLKVGPAFPQPPYSPRTQSAEPSG